MLKLDVVCRVLKVNLTEMLRMSAHDLAFEALRIKKLFILLLEAIYSNKIFRKDSFFISILKINIGVIIIVIIAINLRFGWFN